MPGVVPVLHRLWEVMQNADFRTALWENLMLLGAGYDATLILGIGFSLIDAVLFFLAKY